MSPGSIAQLEKSNPLIFPLADFLRVDDIEVRIRRSPLQGLDMSELNDDDRHVLLNQMWEKLFEPNTVTLELVTRVLRMIGRGYSPRDPRQLSVRKDGLTIASWRGRKLTELPWLDTYALCMRVVGETGTGKTYEVKNALRLLPPYIVHPENKEAGWSHLVQVTCLFVSMSHDGTLGGLLLSILAALDEAIGTTYSTQSSLTRLSNEKLAVHVGIILRFHALGVLVIDEIQERNFTGAHAELSALFFLRLLNFGIPMILMGNPFGLSALDRYSQDVRRTSSAGSIDFEPLDVGDFDWTNCIAPRIWEYYVLPKPMMFSDPDGTILFKYSGGLRDYAFRICNTAQRLALDLGDSALTEEHLQMAYAGADFSAKDRDLIEGFAQRDPMRLIDFVDVRVRHYAKKWGLVAKEAEAEGSPQRDPQATKEPSTGVTGAAEADAPANTKRTRHQKEVASAKRLATRRANEATERENAKKTLATDDLRIDGLKKFLISSFDELRNAA